LVAELVEAVADGVPYEASLGSDLGGALSEASDVSNGKAEAFVKAFKRDYA
jgi:hypothetical protein